MASLEIAPGVRTKAWTYNGGLPGPLIRARKGDRLIVHFSNALPQSTTVHWHGVQVPIEMDGVPGASQPPVEPGGSFTYDFVVPDAGLFWYHPHVMSAAQVGFGLYGPLLVEDPDDAVKVADELVLVLSDIAMDDDGDAALGRQRRHSRRAARPRRQPRARQRPRPADTDRSRRRSAAMAHRQLGEEPLLRARARRRSALRADRRRWRAHGVFTSSDGRSCSVPASEPTCWSRRRLDGRSVTLITNPFNRGFGSTEFRSTEDLIVFAAGARCRRWRPRSCPR